MDTKNDEIWIRETRDIVPDERESLETDRVDVEPSSQSTRETCACGCPNGEKIRPVSKDTFLDFGENLSDRYEDMGLVFDRSAFLRKLEALKSDPSNQFADDRLYKRATRLIVEGKSPKEKVQS